MASSAAARNPNPDDLWDQPNRPSVPEADKIKSRKDELREAGQLLESFHKTPDTIRGFSDGGKDIGHIGRNENREVVGFRGREPDVTSRTAPVQPDRTARPGPGRRPIADRRMKERSFTIDDDVYELMLRRSQLEGLRLRKNISVSMIMRQMCEFADAHIVDDEVFPTPDGKGLHVTKGMN